MQWVLSQHQAHSLRNEDLLSVHWDSAVAQQATLARAPSLEIAAVRMETAVALISTAVKDATSKPVTVPRLLPVFWFLPMVLVELV